MISITTIRGRPSVLNYDVCMTSDTKHHHVLHGTTLQVVLDTATGIFESLAACSEVGCDVVLKVAIFFRYAAGAHAPDILSCHDFRLVPYALVDEVTIKYVERCCYKTSTSKLLSIFHATAECKGVVPTFWCRNCWWQ